MEHKNIAEKLGLMDPLSHDKFVDQELQGLSDDLVGPLMVAWDVTNRCNLKCMHCLNRSGDERYHDFSNELSSSEAIDVCRQIIELNPYSVCLCGGEPLLRTDFFDIVQTLVPHIQNVNAVSNGYIVDAQLAERIADSGLTMFQVSLDSAHEEMHNQFRANSDSFRRALNAIKTLSTHSSIQVAASFCPTRFNIPYFREYVQMLMDAGCFSIRVMPLLPMGRGLDNYRNIKPSPSQYAWLVSEISVLRADFMKDGLYLEWGDPLDHLHRPIIFGHKQVICCEIRSNGDISLSIYLPFSVGNVRKHRLKQYWDNGFNCIWDNVMIKDYASRILTVSDFEEIYPKAWSSPRITFDIIDKGDIKQ